MSRRWGAPSEPLRLPSFLRRRETERRRVDAFVASIRATAPEGTIVDVEQPTVALPMVLVTLLVPAGIDR